MCTVYAVGCHVSLNPNPDTRFKIKTTLKSGGTFKQGEQKGAPMEERMVINQWRAVRAF